MVNLDAGSPKSFNNSLETLSCPQKWAVNRKEVWFDEIKKYFDWVLSLCAPVSKIGECGAKNSQFWGWWSISHSLTHHRPTYVHQCK